MNEPYAEIEPEIEGLKGPVLLDFGTNWCGHCRRAQPLVDAAVAKHPRVRHLKIADASGRRLGRAFGVKRWPTLVFLRDGEELARLVRPQDEAQIGQALQKIETGGV